MTKMVQLYRGIVVSKSNHKITEKDIITNGIKQKNGKNRLEIEDLKDQLEELFSKSDLSTSDTRDQKNKDAHTFVTADKKTAAHYATRSIKEDEIPLVIYFEAPVEELMIDGRDFLANIFQQSRQQEKTPLIKEVLKKMFGEQILRYYEKALHSLEDSYKLAMYDLAMQDREVVEGHLNNQLVVQGRAQVPITSIFFCKMPILPEQIQSIGIAKAPSFEYDYRIRDLT